MGIFRQMKSITGRPADAGEPDTPPPVERDFEPIADVSLRRYAEVTRRLSSSHGGPEAAALVERSGVDKAAWRVAADGWNARIRSNPAVALAFDAHFRETPPPA